MSLPAPLNFKKWIEDNRHLLKPPVGNKCMYNEDYIVMVVGGPNARKDFHYNETPEFFYQVEGAIDLVIMENEEERTITIGEGEMFYLPPKVPHSPRRGPNTVGLVIEYKRDNGMRDALQWYCEHCGEKMYEEDFQLENIEEDMKSIFDKYYSDQNLRTCRNCSQTMLPPA